MNPSKYLTVSAINKYLKVQFERDEHLQCVFLKGEISNFKGHTTGHLYFSLKDETSKINAIMFQSYAKRLQFSPTDGTKVLVMGRIGIYEATGNYQIYVEEMLEDGVGNLYIAYEKLKAQLQKEGLFDSSHKKILPKYPNRIGIVTAPTGAAIKDILSTIKRRYPICETILFPSLVQGDNAANDIVRNIKKAEQYDLDVLIVGRGGGSIEDLWPFNEEVVARAIYDCPIPIISAVGHEIDFTIADFVADHRAPTPTGAAEIAVPNLIDVQKYINQLKIRLQEAIYKDIKYKSLYLDTIKNSFVLKTPMVLFENRQQQIDIINEKLNQLLLQKIDYCKLKLDTMKNHYLLKNPQQLYIEAKKQLKIIIDKLQLVNPLNILNRGYSLTYQANKIIKVVEDIDMNKDLSIKISNGIIEANIVKVEEIKDEERN